MCDDLSLLELRDNISESDLCENLPAEYHSKEFFTSADDKDLIGCGSYAFVRRCYHHKLNYIVVKYFLLNGSKELIQKKFQDAIKEAKVLGSIHHPNIVRVFGITSWKNCCGIVMEEITGGTLEDLLHEKQTHCLSWKDQLKFFYEISNALSYLHYNNPKKSFVHGDLKPQNILLTKNLTIKLADFGSVAIIHATGMVSSSLNPCSKQYTPLYSAPEFLNDFKKQTCAIDIYSFAMIGYEILTRCRVYDDSSATLSVLISLIRETGLKPNRDKLSDVEKSLSETNLDIFLHLKNIVVSCWHYNPEERLKSSEILELLRSLLSPNEIDTYLKSQYSEFSSSNFDKSNLIALNDCTGPSDFSLMNCNQNMLPLNSNDLLCSKNLLDYLSKNLQVCYRVITNFKKQSSPQEVTLLNRGNKFIPKENLDWSLYFNDFHLLEYRHLRTSDKCLLPNCPFELIHVDGTLYKLQPTTQFEGLKPGETVIINFCSYETISKDYVFPRWYVCAPGLKPQIIQATDDKMQFVSDFTTAEQWKRSLDDPSNPFSAAKRFQLYNISDFGYAPLRIIPSPIYEKLDNTNFVAIYPKEWFVCSKSNCFKAEMYLIRDTFGIAILEENYFPSSKVITFNQGSVDGVRECQDSYMIVINSSQSCINITACGRSGAFYAVQSLISLVEPQKQDSWFKLPSGIIKDTPRFEYRGLVVDVARNFIARNDIQLIIETMALYKLNKLVLHLADNEGWRIEIKGLPELTEIGAVRCHSETGKEGVLPAFGSGPYDNTSGSGYYSVSDYRTILEIAAANCIEVIPTIGMPGNFHAAILSMSVRYERLLQENKIKEAQEFLLTNPDYSSATTCLYNHKNSFANPYLDSTYRFIDHVVTSLKEMHQDIQPLQIILFGGDGIPKSSDKWNNSEFVQKFKERHLCDNVKTDQELFMFKISKLCLNHSIKMGVYGNGALRESSKEPYESSIFNNHDVMVYAVNPRLIEPFSNIAHSLANADYEVIVGHCSALFLDHPQEPDPNEKGMSWATRYIDDKMIFSFMPEDLNKNCDSDTYGSTFPLSNPDKREKNLIKLAKHKNIVGVQASLWTELLRNTQNVHHQLFPRLIAFAERAWHKAEWEISSCDKVQELQSKDWENYANVIGYRELPRLKSRGIFYRIPPPGVINFQNQFQLASLYPGLKYFYRKTSSLSTSPWVECKNNDVIPDINSNYEFATSDGVRKSRIVKVNADELNPSEENFRCISKMRQFDAHMSYEF